MRTVLKGECMKRVLAIAAVGFAAFAAFAGSASANIITITGTTATIDCAPSCQAFTGSGGGGTGPTGAGILSSTIADFYDGTPSSSAFEADRLSILITGSTGLFSAIDATQSPDTPANFNFSTLAEYVVLKVGQYDVFLKNISGGLLTINYVSSPGFGLSHFTEFGQVPIPGAIWLMAAGLAGFGFAGRVKKAKV